MSGVGSVYDRALMESFFATLKQYLRPPRGDPTPEILTAEYFDLQWPKFGFGDNIILCTKLFISSSTDTYKKSS